ncbi:MAG: thioredoxin [Candidatus Melainabacteria bacterium HGW-Melainabacteria-1]|nr:MAG: thioredoxin [Candidatus Melainabacteria bacterium HGW-Melainabacteria-1]
MSTAKPSRLPYLILSVVLIGIGAWAAVMFTSRPTDAPLAQNSVAPGTAPDTGGSLEGQLAPDFSGVELKGAAIKLADYRGKVVFLNFWATWCEPCKEEMPSMERLYQKFKGQPFEILAVSLDANPTQDVPAFLSKTKMSLSFPLLMDKDQLISKQLYRTTGVPESFIIGPDGKVIKHAIGKYEWDSQPIIDYFDNLLKAVKAGLPQPAQG